MYDVTGRQTRVLAIKDTRGQRVQARVGGGACKKADAGKAVYSRLALCEYFFILC